MRVPRRRFLQLTAAAATVLAVISLISGLLPMAASAQFREQPVRIVFPFAAGGSGDALARMVAEQMLISLGRPAIVENRTGGNGRIGVSTVKKAAPDGSTLLITPIAPMAVYQHVYKALDYDPITDFAPVSQLATYDFGLAVGSQIPVRSLGELVAWVKAEPARAVIGGPGTGDLTHFLSVLFGRAAGLDLRHVAYRGSAAALPDLLAGHIPMLLTGISDLVQMHNAGRIRILAASGHERSLFAPDVPTFREGGYDVEGSGWYGTFAPAKTPTAVVDRYSAAMAAAVRVPQIAERLRGFGLQPTGTSPAQLAAIQKSDSQRWALAVQISVPEE